MMLSALLLNKKLLTGLGVVVLLAVSGGSVYFLGSSHGAAAIQTQWDRDTLKRDKATRALQLEITAKETTHTAESQRIARELTNLKENHAKSLAAVQLEYTHRLRTSENRASIYKRQAEGGTLERDRLVEFTTELDRTVVEGRQLVGQLRETLGQCERQRQLYYEQITNDRRLY